MSLLRRVLKPAAQPFYLGALRGFQMGLRLRGVPAGTEVWARNSYRLGNWIPFQSDVDLSLWMPHEPDTQAIQNIRSTHAAVKKLLPVLGEMNLYVADDRKWTELLINRFELDRDPQLSEKILAHGAVGARFEAAAFLLRMLESDIARVLHRPQGRQAKWAVHAARVEEVLKHEVTGGDGVRFWGENPDRPLVRGILEAISWILYGNGEIPPADREGFVDVLERYLRSTDQGEPAHLLVSLLDENPGLWAAFPHRFCFRTEGLPILDGIWRSLAQAQVCWELFGMLTQYRLSIRTAEEKAGLRRHLERLQEFYRVSIQRQEAPSELDQSVSEVTEHLLRSL
jgi:hypothetical protein